MLEIEKVGFGQSDQSAVVCDFIILTIFSWVLVSPS